MNLYYREYGERNARKPLILLHGLFGSSANWMGIARKLSAEHYVVTPDLRNHGRSGHDADVSYAAMAQDLRQLMRKLEIPQAVIVGHSMGGKTAMSLALECPDEVAALVVVDMSPVKYTHNFDDVFTAFSSIDLASLIDRQAAQSSLTQRLSSDMLAGYLLQNLNKTPEGWRWRLNLSALLEKSKEITGFILPPESTPYTRQTVFIYGEESDYLKPDYYEEINRLFPNAGLIPIANAGHWVYFDQPLEFMQQLTAFLAQL